MRNLYIILLLFILAGCSDTNGLILDDTIANNQVPAVFSLDNFKKNEPISQLHTKYMELANDSKLITTSMEQEEWAGREFLQAKAATSWTDVDNKVTWAIGDQIGVFMRDAGGSNSYMRNNVLHTVSSAGASVASLTAGASPLYFPNRSSSIKFYAYYPYSATSNTLLISYTLPADQSTPQALGKADIMYAPTSSYTGALPNVSLNLNHQMTLLSFRIKGGLLSGLFTLTQVTVSGSAITSTGTLDLATGTLTPNTSGIFIATVNTSKPVSSTDVANVDVIINPCTISNNSSILPTQLKVTLSFSGLIPHSTNLITNGIFAKGTRYIYNLSVAL